MQTTLLGLAIAIILALVAALVAPFVIDWGNYRSTFEEQASRLTGLNVRVNGRIDARILPTPLVKLHDVEVGAAGAEPQLRIGTLELEVGLGPLLRGEVQASRLHLVAPQLNLGLNRNGTVDWPALLPSFSPEAFSISSFTIENARVVLADAASGSRVALQKLSFAGDIRSFTGPIRGDGAFVFGNEPYAYRISGNGTENEQGFKIRLGVDPANHPLTTEIEGTLISDHGVPQFDGTFALARPVGFALSSGRRVVSDPWHARGKIRGTSASAALTDVEFQYGPDDRAVNFGGRADLTFGERPHLDGVVSALQVNVDRAMAAPDVTYRPPLLVIKSFVEDFVAIAKLPMPAQLAVGVDAVTVGGTTIQSLRGEMRFDETGWSFDHFAFRAPGVSQISLSGRLKDTPRGPAFSGPATLESADVEMLLAWLKGDSDRPSPQAKPFRASGDVTVASDRLAFDHLAATLGEENLEGRLAYTWAIGKRPAILDADLRAAALDLDALAAFGKAAAADKAFELPREVTLALDIGKATFAGVEARQVKAKGKLDAGVLQVERLSVGAVAGAALEMSGRIDEVSSQPRGRVTLDLDAPVLDGLANVIGRFAPQSAEALRRFADRLAPAKLHGVLTVERAAPSGSAAKFDVNGQVGVMRVALKGDAKGDPSRVEEATVRLESRLDADDGGTLIKLLGVDRIVAVDQLPGRLTLAATGPVSGDLHVDGLVTAGGFAAAAQGALRLSGEQAPNGSLQFKVSAADPRPLHQILTGQAGAAVPVSANGAMAIAGTDLSFSNLAVAIGKISLHGRLALNLANPISLDGDIASGDIDAISALALLSGLPTKAPGAGGPWSSEQLGAGAFTAVNGAVTFKLDRAAFTPTLVVRDLKGVAHLRPGEIGLDNLDGSLGGGHLAGELALRHNPDGLIARMRVELGSADAATILAPDKKVLDGTLTVKLEGDSSGATPAGLIDALHGSGTVTLAGAHFAGLDPAAFDAAMRAADQSGTIEPPKIQAAVTAAMANGHLALPRSDAALTIAAGRLDLANAMLPAQDGATLSLTGTLDLHDATIDAHMVLSGQRTARALITTRPELSVRLKGPLAAPERTLDVSALAGWLALRAAELQTRRIESIEANRRPDTFGPVVRPLSPVIRIVPNGAVVESELPATLSAAPAPGARALDRLQPELPLVVPDQPRPDLGSDARGAAPSASLPSPMQTTPIVPRLRPRPNNAAGAAGTPELNKPELNKQTPAPQPATPPAKPAAPQPAAPKSRSPFDFLFGTQH